ncbi:copper resistance D family protein [Prauserella oleivorans]|uniref:Copper resistance D family protein n=1 Tax=Prauserella oleivorans TaxID=1478153 RepID=A0ABW5WHQ3_9PSEU
MTRSGTTSRPRAAALVSVLTAGVAGALIGVALTAATPVSGVTAVDEVVSVGIPVVRVLMNLAAVAAIGLALLPVLVGYDRPKLSGPVLATARPPAVAAALVWCVAALVTLVLQTAEYRGGTGGVGFGDIRGYVADVAAGKALLIVAGLTLGLAVLNMLAVRHGEKVPAEVRVGLGLFALLPLPVTGHAGGFSLHDYTMISIELHVMSAVAWTGGLGAVACLLATNRAVLAYALPRFSKLATLCLGLSAATGLFNGVVELDLAPTMDLWTALIGTGYGRLVLLKAACLVAVAAFGAYLRWRLLPQVVRHQRTALAKWATLELTVMGLAFGFAVVLARTPVA